MADRKEVYELSKILMADFIMYGQTKPQQGSRALSTNIR